MSRPKKWRIVCCMPDRDRFGPLDPRPVHGDTVHMTIDEYETIRLIDLEKFTQEECAVQMNVARTTVQGIYDNARTKLAESLVNGREICIKGGDYRLCDGTGRMCRNEGCCRRRREQD